MGTNIKYDVSVSKSKQLYPTEKFVIISRESECSLTEIAKKDQMCISEDDTIGTEDNIGCSNFDFPDRGYTDDDPSKSETFEPLHLEVTQCEEIIRNEEIEREQDSDPPDVIVNKRSPYKVSNSEPHDTIVDKRSLHAESKNDPSVVITDKRTLNITSYSNLPNVIVDKKSLDKTSYSNPPNVIVDKRSVDTRSYGDPPDVVVGKRSIDAISYSNPSNTILVLFVLTMLDVLDTPSYSDPYDTIVDTGSFVTCTSSHSDPSVAIVDMESDGAFSDSDTLDEIDDIEPDDATILTEERALIDQDEAASVCDVDNIADGEDATDDDVATDDDGSTDDDDVTDDDGVADHDDKIFGIMNIYKESDLHYYLNDVPAAEHAVTGSAVGFMACVSPPDLLNLGHQHTILFDKIFTNTGGAYRNHTGVFTAPVKGLYEFHLTAMSVAGSHQYLSFVRDGMALTKIYPDAAGSSSYETAGNQWVVELNQGSEVWIQTHIAGKIHGNCFTVFSGFLIEEME